MKLYDAKQERADVMAVAALWDRLHKEYEPPERAGEISKALHALDVTTATAEDVAKVIGDGSWIELPVCDGCDEMTREAVGFGWEAEHGQQMVWACRGCLLKAVAMLDARAKESLKLEKI